MKKLRDLRKRRSFLFRLVISVFSLLAVAFLLVSAVIFYGHSQELKARYEQRCTFMAMTVCDQMEKSVDSIHRLGARIAMQERAQSHSMSLTEHRVLRESLQMACSASPLATRIALYLPAIDDSGNLLFMETGTIHTDHFAADVLFTDTETLLGLFRDGATGYAEYNPVRKSGFFSVPLTTVSSSYSNGTMLLLYSGTSIQNMLEPFMPSGYRLVEITSPSGFSMYFDPQLKDRVGESSAAFREIDLEEEIYFACSVKNEKGYSALVLIPRATLDAMPEYYRNLVPQYLVLTLVVCLLLLALVVFIDYRPMHRLLTSMLGGRSRDREKNEIDEMEAIWADRQEMERKIREDLIESRMLLIDRAYEHLLQGGDISDPEFQILQDFMPSYLVACISRKGQDLSDLRKVFENDLTTRFYLARSPQEDPAVLLCRLEDEEESGDDSRQQILKKIRGQAADAIITMSSASNSPRDVYSLYRQAEETLRVLLGNKTPSEKQANTERMIELYINENFTDPNLSVSSVAQQFNISDYTAGRLLRGIYGSNFRHTITEKRISYACSLMIDSDLSVSTIGEMSGFLNTSYFIKVFQQSKGCTPKQYREISRNIKNEL